MQCILVVIMLRHPLIKLTCTVTVTVTVTVTGNLLNTKGFTLVSRQLSQPVQSPRAEVYCRHATMCSRNCTYATVYVRNVFRILDHKLEGKVIKDGTV
jgi:hypothetical protein